MRNIYRHGLNLGQKVFFISGYEWYLSKQQFIADNSNSPHIALKRVDIMSECLWRHIEGGTNIAAEDVLLVCLDRKPEIC
jgi:hypothetical protein